MIAPRRRELLEPSEAQVTRSATGMGKSQPGLTRPPVWASTSTSAPSLPWPATSQVRTPRWVTVQPRFGLVLCGESRSSGRAQPGDGRGAPRSRSPSASDRVSGRSGRVPNMSRTRQFRAALTAPRQTQTPVSTAKALQMSIGARRSRRDLSGGCPSTRIGFWVRVQVVSPPDNKAFSFGSRPQARFRLLASTGESPLRCDRFAALTGRTLARRENSR